VSRGKVYFVGAGPGAPDLLTLRAAEAMERSDVVIWGRSLLMEDAVRRHTRPDAELITWPPATMRDVLAAYDRARDEGIVVTRLKSGDPTLFGEMAEELNAVRERGLDFEVVPGVSSPAAAAAAFRAELTPLPGSGAVRVVGGAGGRPVSGAPDTLAVLLTVESAPDALDRLIAEGIPPDTPCAVGYRVSWPDETLLECRLDELAGRLDDLGLRGPAVALLRPTAGRE